MKKLIVIALLLAIGVFCFAVDMSLDESKLFGYANTNGELSQLELGYGDYLNDDVQYNVSLVGIDDKSSDVVFDRYMIEFTVAWQGQNRID